MDYLPQFYNPYPETFVERASGVDGIDINQSFTFYTTNSGIIKKIYTNFENFTNVITQGKSYFEIVDPLAFQQTAAYLQNQSGFQYINFPGNTIRIKSVFLPSEAFYEKISVASIPQSVNNGKVFSLDVGLLNSSKVPWLTTDRVHSLALSYHWLNESGKMLPYDGWRTIIPYPIFAGQERNIKMTIIAPPNDGNYIMEMDLVQIGYTWFKDKGGQTTRIPIKVRSSLNN
jgi:hypothetical protein